MFGTFNRNEKGQTALETAIILIAFVVVASVFAFTILSAGSASTERGEQAIYSGLEGVQASLQVRGAVTGVGASNALSQVVFTVAPVSGGEPINMDDTAASNVVVVVYRDSLVNLNDLTWTQAVIVGDADDLLEEGELMQVTASIPAANRPGPNTEFTIEVKPPVGGVLTLTRTTPAAIGAVVELR